MTPRSIAWSIYGAFLLFWWIMVITPFVRYKLHRETPGIVIAHVERQLGIHLARTREAVSRLDPGL
jgi:hypothetical protein